ncbi:MAG: RteC domain-containing protein [Bacteroidota bacterium]
MDYKTEAQTIFIDEMTKSKIEIRFSGEYFHNAFPLWSPFENEDEEEDKEVNDKIINKGKYDINLLEPNMDGGILKSFFPFSISINDKFESPLEFPFKADEGYEPYFRSITENLLAEIEQNVKMRIGVWHVLDYLTLLKFELKDIRNKFNLQKGRKIEMHDFPIYWNTNIHENIINNEEYSPYEGLYVDYSLSRYWDIQIKYLDRVNKIIDTHIKNIKKSDDYVLEKEKESTYNNLLWTKSDTDILELVTALFEHGAIQNKTKDLTHKEAIKVFSDLFGIEVKDQYKKLNAARARKKEGPAFLERIQESLEAYYEKQDEKSK